MCVIFRKAFSRNNEPTMIPIPDNNVEIGQARQMSPNDILRINRLYCSTWSHTVIWLVYTGLSEFLFNLANKLVKRAGGLYSGVCNYCNSYDNKIFIFMFIVYCYFFPSEWSAAVFMKDVFDDSIHLFISAFIILYHHFFMFPYLHITVSNDFSYLSFKNDKYFKIILQSDSS